MKKNVLVFGASGFIGRHFCRFVGNDYDMLQVAGRLDSDDCNIRFNFYDYEQSLNTFMDYVGAVVFDSVIFLQGTNPVTGVDSITVNNFNNMMMLNVSIPTLLIKELSKNNLSQDCSVIFMSSIASKKGSYDPSYAAAKSAIQGLAQSLSNWKPTMRFNSISLGLVKYSPVYFGMTQDFIDKHTQAMGGSLVDVKDVCKAICLLVECDSISRTTIDIDCGYRV